MQVSICLSASFLLLFYRWYIVKQLIIYAHPNGDSYNHALLQAARAALVRHGHSVEVHDLYRMAFNPVLSAADLASYRSGALAADVVAEQRAVADADAITFVFPVWWTGAPAIVKGWLDRVFSFNFAYGVDAGGGIRKLLTGKQGAVLATHGTPKAIYDQSGMSTSMAQIFDDGVFRFTGIEPVLHLALGSVGGGTPRVELEQQLRDVDAAFAAAFPR